MTGTESLNSVRADRDMIAKTAEVIRDESEGFINDLIALEECMKELSGCWEGEAKKKFDFWMSFDFFELDQAAWLFKRVSEYYDFAIKEYTKNAQKALETVKAVR